MADQQPQPDSLDQSLQDVKLNLAVAKTKAQALQAARKEHEDALTQVKAHVAAHLDRVQKLLDEVSVP